jgi:hypothetical protein
MVKRLAPGWSRWGALVLVALLGYLAGAVTSSALPVVHAQKKSGRFVNIGEDGPFRLWRDTKTDQCFIVTTPYYAMLSVGPC